MPRHRRRFLRTLGTLGTVPLVAGCLEGGSNPGTATDTLHHHTTDPSDGTPTGGDAKGQFPSYSWGRLDGVDPAPATDITMSGFEFDPLVATMPPGTEVTVVNEDSASHTITIPALEIKETLSGGGSTSFTVEQTGTFDYVCEFHAPDMLGRLVVEEGAPTPTATESSGGDSGTATETDDGYDY